MKFYQLLSGSLALFLLGGGVSSGVLANDGPSLFKKHQCFTCHGDSGQGDGIVGKSLPKGTMPDFTKGVFKFATSESKFAELLKKGGAGVKLNPLMPPALGVKPAEVSVLYQYVLSFKK